MKIDRLQTKLIKQVFQYLKNLKKNKINIPLSSLTYMPTYGLCPGFFNLRKIETNKKQKTFIFNLKNFLSISKLSSLVMKGKALTKNHKYNFLFVSWANEEDFLSNGEYFDSYFKISSRHKKILWLLIFMGRSIPKKIDGNILIIHNKKVFFKYNLFFLVNYFLTIITRNRLDFKNIFHQLSQETCFALKMDSFLKEILSKKKIDRLYLPYESQTFQNKIILTAKAYNKRIKVYGYDHSIDALPINNIYKSPSPDFLYIHSHAQKNIYIKFLKWPKKKVISIPSLRFLKKGKQFFDQKVFLPYNILSKDELIKNFEIFLNYFSSKKIKPLNVRIHPFQKKSKKHNLFKKEINDLIKNYENIFSNTSKHSYSVFFGATSSVIEALENGSNAIHIVDNATFETYSSKLWPSINVNMINKNIFRYTLKTKNKCITFGNRQRNFNLPNFLPKV